MIKVSDFPRLLLTVVFKYMKIRKKTEITKHFIQFKKKKNLNWKSLIINYTKQVLNIDFFKKETEYSI